MDVTLLTAKIFGVYLMVSGLFLILKGKAVPHMLKDFFDHPAVMYLTGIILIFLSSMYLIVYNIWDGTWRVIITIFVWLVLLKGLTYIFMPKALGESVIRKFRGTFGFFGMVSVFVGICLFCLS